MISDRENNQFILERVCGYNEFLPAVIKSDGNVSAMHINPSDNRGAGASLMHQMSNLPDGTRVVIKVLPR